MSISCADGLLRKAAEKTKGQPYLMQLMGYYLTMYADDKTGITETVLRKAEEAALKDMDDNVYWPTLSPLSDNDRLFLSTMALCQEPVKTAELKEKLGEKGSSLQIYRKRLIDAGIIEAPRKGELTFAIPYFREYLGKMRE